MKLTHITELTKQREAIAKRYQGEIKNPEIILPMTREEASHVWHLFVVRVNNRDDFAEHMKEKGIDILIHYPIPPHLSGAYAYLGYKTGDFPVTEEYARTVATLPLFNGMTHEEQSTVIDAINEWRQ